MPWSGLSERGERVAPIPGAFDGVVYLDFLAELCRKRAVRRYLEIGVHFGHTFSRICCDVAVGVDPGFVLDTNVMAGKRRALLVQTTSERFFADEDVPALFGGPVELAFLDGLHQFEVLLRDFANTEAVSGPDGLIALHDCLPLSPEMAGRDPDAPRTDPEPLNRMWTGDVWKLVPILRRYRPDLQVVLVDCPPTGLVCVTGLDPTSRVLNARYLEIVREFREVPNGAAEIGAMYGVGPVVSSRAILNGQDQSLWFRG